MSNLDTYVSIQDLLHTVFRAAYVDTNLNCRRDEDDVGRYMYSPKLAFHLKTALGEERKNQNASAEETKIEAEEDSDSAAETPLTEHEVEQARLASIKYANVPANFAHLGARGTPHHQTAATPPPRTPTTRGTVNYNRDAVHTINVRLPSLTRRDGESETEYRERRISATEFPPPSDTPPEPPRASDLFLTAINRPRSPRTGSRPHDEPPPTPSPLSSTPTTRRRQLDDPPYTFLLSNEKSTSTTHDNTEQIDYDRIINRAYDPCASETDSEDTPTVIVTPSDPHHDDINNQINLEEDIDNFFQNQDRLQEQEGEELLSNAAAEEELHRMGEELSLKATTEEEVHRMIRDYQTEQEQEQTISTT